MKLTIEEDPIVDLKAAFEAVAINVEKQGYAMEAARIRGLCDGLTCTHDYDVPVDALLGAQHLLGAKIGGEFFFRYSLPTLLRMKAMHES